MRLILFSLAASLICSVAFANDIYVTQTGTGDTLTLDITQEGENNTVNFSVGNHAGNTVKIDQDTDNSYVGYTTLWGSGLAWGGDLDGDDNFMDIYDKINYRNKIKKDDLRSKLFTFFGKKYLKQINNNKDKLIK